MDLEQDVYLQSEMIETATTAPWRRLDAASKFSRDSFPAIDNNVQLETFQANDYLKKAIPKKKKKDMRS